MSAGIIYNNGIALTATAAGNSGDVLTSQGSGSAPIFAPSSGGGGSTLLFYARLTSVQSNVTGDGTSFPIIYGTADVNVGSCYNTSTGIFTVPATGVYQFQAGVFIQNVGVAHNEFYMNLIDITTGNAPTYFEFNPYPMSVSGTLQFNGFINYLYPTQTTAGDQINNSITVLGSTKTINVYGSSTLPNNYWACYRVA